MIFGYEPLKVQHIYNNGYDDVVAEITEEAFNEYGVCEEIIDVMLVNCSPIPLTAEILEKNGWERHDIFMDMKVAADVIFSWTDMYGKSLLQNGYHMCYCKYVHTLQHALRLAGLNELADNFKI